MDLARRTARINAQLVMRVCLRNTPVAALGIIHNPLAHHEHRQFGVISLIKLTSRAAYGFVRCAHVDRHGERFFFHINTQFPDVDLGHPRRASRGDILEVHSFAEQLVGMPVVFNADRDDAGRPIVQPFSLNEAFARSHFVPHFTLPEV